MASAKTSDAKQLDLIRASIYDPGRERDALLLLLEDIYRSVETSWNPRAPNGGKLVEPELENLRKCDARFTYNAVRVLLARYLARDEYGRVMETPCMLMKRVAHGFRDYVDVERLYDLLVSRRFMFNSPTLFNMYADGAKGTLSACYVTPVYDDMESIMDAARVQAMTFKWGGGQGFSFSELRPRWDIVRGTSSTASGPLSFMRLYDIVTEVVKQGGKRRGANMGIMHAWHPDIYTPGFDPYSALVNSLPPSVRYMVELLVELVEEAKGHGLAPAPWLEELVEKLRNPGPWSIEDAGFVQAKEPPLHDANLTNFNISVAVNDVFMENVLLDGEWRMVNPRYSERDDVYRIHYSVSKATGLGRLGDLLDRFKWLTRNPYFNIYEDVLEESWQKACKDAEAAGLVCDQKNSYAWKLRARELWEKIVQNAWAGGDPGLLYIDNHNKWSPTPWLGLQNATNPCGEQVLYPFESCNLGSMSIEKYVEKGVFKLDEFAKDVAVVVDAMDAVIDLNKHPDARQEKANRLTRKIGLGVMGLADALAKLGYPYDSEEAVAFTLVVLAALEVFAWKRSWELGALKGHAPAFECKKWDWKRMVCLEKASPAETVKLHTPALVKAGAVMSVKEGWITVKYHDVVVPGDVRERLRGETRNRVAENGEVKLVSVEALEKVLREVFGVTREHYWEALSMSPARLVASPKHLLALTIYSPGHAWEALRSYGHMIGAEAPRNTVATTVAPTGSISIIAGTSSGIEPYFALVYKRVVSVGEFLEVVRLFREKLLEAARRYGIDRDVLELVYDEIRRGKGSLRKAIPQIRDKLIERGITNGFLAELEKLARLFPTSMDFDPWYHLAHQAAAQLYVDQSISKTVNLAKNASVDDVYTVYVVGWLMGLKGITVYRDESKTVQVIYYGAGEEGVKKKLLRPVRRSREARRARKLRMVHLKKRMRVSQLRQDPKLNELFEFREVESNGSGGGEVVVELTENSTCKTCEY